MLFLQLVEVNSLSVKNTYFNFLKKIYSSYVRETGV
jgi:hypothetical protein